MTPALLRRTIYALASAPGRSGIAVFRVSGPSAADVFRHLSGRPLPSPRVATRVRLTHNNDALDDGLALWFPAPHSFTGEDVVEFHVHGGRAVGIALAEAFHSLGLSPAAPGEFSKRAFLHHKLDLTQAEAIADLVDAETAAQRRQALRQLDGRLASLTASWRTQLVRTLALLEAAIDFSDEDLPPTLLTEVQTLTADLISHLEEHVSTSHSGERLRDGIHITLLGAPNAGKSSLLNRLAGRDAAIVSAIAGTTRDIIDVHLDLKGWPVILTDTAGLRPSEEEIEAEGIRRARAKAESADLKLLVFDASQLPDLDAHTRAMLDSESLVLFNKADLLGGPPPEQLDGCLAVAVSARTGSGIDSLLSILETEIVRRFSTLEAPALTRVRHRQAVEDCILSLKCSQIAPEVELAAEDVRLAARAIGRITGQVDVEEVLDVIFASFCIGK